MSLLSFMLFFTLAHTFFASIPKYLMDFVTIMIRLFLSSSLPPLSSSILLFPSFLSLFSFSSYISFLTYLIQLIGFDYR